MRQKGSMTVFALVLLGVLAVSFGFQLQTYQAQERAEKLIEQEYWQLIQQRHRQANDRRQFGPEFKNEQGKGEFRR